MAGVCRFFHCCEALSAIAPVVDLGFLDYEVVCRLLHIHFLQWNVDYPSASLALEVGVGRGVAVVVGSALVDGQLENGVMLFEQLQRVVNCGARQCWHRLYKFAVDCVDGGVRAVAEQIVHYCYPLCRRLYAVCREMCYCFV